MVTRRSVFISSLPLIHTHPVHDHAADFQHRHVCFLAFVSFPHDGADALQTRIGAVEPRHMTLHTHTHTHTHHLHAYSNKTPGPSTTNLKQRGISSGSVTHLMKRVVSELFLGGGADGGSVSIGLAGAGRAALGAVQEVLPQNILRLRLVPRALRVLRPRAGAPRAAAGARLQRLLRTTHT